MAIEQSTPEEITDELFEENDDALDTSYASYEVGQFREALIKAIRIERGKAFKRGADALRRELSSRLNYALQWADLDEGIKAELLHQISIIQVVEDERKATASNER